MGPILPTIVLGLSGQIDKLVDIGAVARYHSLLLLFFSLDLLSLFRDKVTMIRRFSGGGTVVVDSSTIFVSLIINVISQIYITPA